MPKHIGIAAVSPEGSALCYREIYRHAGRILGDTGHPRVTLHNEPFEDYMAAVLRDDWTAVGALLARSARLLARAGAEFAIVPDNVMQHAVHLAETDSPIPWLTMTDLVAEAISAENRSTVGLIGTRMVMTGSTYQTHLGIRGVKVVIPKEEDAEDIDAIIFRELVYGVVRPESRKRVLGVIDQLRERGCEGVILGCSEGSLLVSPTDCEVPVYDPNGLLALGAIQCAIGERSLDQNP